MSFEGMDKLAAKGQELLNSSRPVETHSAFNEWISEVARWLSDRFPDTGLAAEWSAQGSSNLVMGGGYHNDPATWSLFYMQVQSRLRWLGRLPTKVQLLNFSIPKLSKSEGKESDRIDTKLQSKSRTYVDSGRIADLKALPVGSFDLSKVIRICEELNICFAGKCYLAVIMQTRALIDHVPPIFGFKTFSQVSSSYGGGKSFKDAMANLDNSSRKIADIYLHGQIRKSEVLPNATQIDFSNNIDLLLSEIVRVLK